MNGEWIDFIPTVADRFIVTLKYSQPLTLTEADLIEDSVERGVERGLRFLVQPGMNYMIYRNPSRVVAPPYMEYTDLLGTEGILQVAYPNEIQNMSYVRADTDNDSIPDTNDNCIATPNADQMDKDNNLRGDVCEDFDRDYVMDNVDNCPNFPHGDQWDTDSDGLGDECDTEETKLTERLPWVPWVGMGFAGLVLLGLFTFVVMDIKRKKLTEGTEA